MSPAVLKKIVGITGVVAMIVASYVMLQVATSANGTTYTAVFDNVKGLVKYSDVTYAGAKVGSVQDIQVTPDGEKARITVVLEQPVPLKSDASMQMRVKSLLGELYMNLDPGKEQAALTGSVIKRTGSDLSLDDLLYSASGILTDVANSHQVKRLTEELQVSFAGKTADLSDINTNSQVLLNSLADRSAVLGQIIQNLDQLTQGLDNRTSTLGNVVAASANALKELRGALAKNMDTIQNTLVTLRTSLQQVNSDKVNAALATIPAWTDKIDNVIVLLDQLTKGQRPVAVYFTSIPDLTKNFDDFMRLVATTPFLAGLKQQLITQLKADIAKQPDTFGGKRLPMSPPAPGAAPAGG